MVPVAMAMALLGHQVHESRRQRAVVESLMSRGADVRFSSDASNPFEWLDTGYASRVTIVKHLLTGNPDLSPLAELKNLRRILVDGTQVSDEQAVFLRRVLPNCEVVKIGWSKPQ